MQRTFIATLILAATFGIASPALAGEGGSCHFHGSKPAAEGTVGGCAADRKAALIKAGKLEASWQSVQASTVEAVETQKGKEWKVTFKNPAAADKTKDTLYMFFTVPGNFIAANFTGQ
jgi:Family of unknown function (DUF6488)